MNPELMAMMQDPYKRKGLGGAGKISGNAEAGALGGELFKFFTLANIQTRVWHLQTTSYAEHMALGGFYDAIGDFQDTLIETMQGYYATRISGDMSFNVDPEYGSGKSKVFLEKFKTYLHEVYQDKLLQPGCLKNIMDEVTALVDKTLYLLTLS